MSAMSEYEIMNRLNRSYAPLERNFDVERFLPWLIVTTMFLTPWTPNPTVLAGEGCDRCGCHSNCRWVCKLVREEKKITYTCWGIAEDKFCVGSPSMVQSRERDTVCEVCSTDAEQETKDGKDAKDGNKNQSVSTGPSIWAWKTWCPGDSAQIFTKKKLMKKTETKTIPSFKWVVEDLCEECRKGKQHSSSDGTTSK